MDKRFYQYKPYKELPPALARRRGCTSQRQGPGLACTGQGRRGVEAAGGDVALEPDQATTTYVLISCRMVPPLDGQSILLLLSLSNDRGANQGLRRSPVQQFCSARQRYTWRGSSSSAPSLSPRPSLGRSRSLISSANRAGPTSASSPCSPPGIVHTCVRVSRIHTVREAQSAIRWAHHSRRDVWPCEILWYVLAAGV